MRSIVLLFSLVAVGWIVAVDAQVTQGRPPMGWNSYDGYTCTVTETEMKENALLVAKHLKSFGYDSVTVDYEWYRPGTGNFDCAGAWADLVIDDYGRLIPSPDRYPSSVNGAGLKPLADFVHNLGLKFGIHIMRGIPRIAALINTPIYGSKYYVTDATSSDPNTLCWWSLDMWGVNMSSPAGQAYYNSILQLYASWAWQAITAKTQQQVGPHPMNISCSSTSAPGWWSTWGSGGSVGSTSSSVSCAQPEALFGARSISSSHFSNCGPPM